MSARRSVLLGAISGAVVAALVAAGSRIYRSRALDRRPSLGAIEVPEASAAFAHIASLPQMWLLRRLAIQRALALFGEAPVARNAVDLGCGPGHLVVELAEAAPGLRVTGIDLSTPLLGEAQRRAIEAGLAQQVDFRTGDVSAAPLGDASVDLAISTLSLHHWDDPIAVLDEVARILRPGGHFLIFDLRRDMIPPFYLLIWFATRYIVPQALRHMGEPMGSRNAAYTPGEAAALAQASRLTGWHVASGPFWMSIEGTKVG
ncbi:MAG: class I SAM-dependent methyltransferase [Nitrososphaerales archaeon]